MAKRKSSKVKRKPAKSQDHVLHSSTVSRGHDVEMPGTFTVLPTAEERRRLSAELAAAIAEVGAVTRRLAKAAPLAEGDELRLVARSIDALGIVASSLRSARESKTTPVWSIC